MDVKKEIELNFGLTESDISRISNDCKKEAVDFGKSLEGKFCISTEDFYLLDDIADYFWKQEKSINLKINIGFELYELFPRYFQFLIPYYRLVKNPEYSNFSEEDEKNYVAAKKLIWEKFMYYLGSEKYYADPVGYVLWVEFFEDSATADETWEGLMQFTTNKNAVKKLLEMSGPAPFELKEILYQKLISEIEFHQVIFKSLLFSSFDLYGKIDKQSALTILSKLDISETTEHYQKLKQNLIS